jgi:putative transposase
MKHYLESQRHWLTVETLPGYAPDLNPVETLWGNLEGQELANRWTEDLAELDIAICNGMKRIRRARQLPLAFLKHSGLSF